MMSAAFQDVMCVPMRLSKSATGVFGDLPDQLTSPMPQSELSDVLKELNIAARNARVVTLQVAGAVLLAVGVVAFGGFRLRYQFVDGTEEAGVSALERGAAWFAVITLPGALLLALGAREQRLRYTALVLVLVGSLMQSLGYAVWIDMEGEAAAAPWGSWGLALYVFGTVLAAADFCQSALCLDQRTIAAVNKRLTSVSERYKDQGIFFELRHSPILGDAGGENYALVVQGTPA